MLFEGKVLFRAKKYRGANRNRTIIKEYVSKLIFYKVYSSFFLLFFSE